MFRCLNSTKLAIKVNLAIQVLHEERSGENLSSGINSWIWIEWSILADGFIQGAGRNGVKFRTFNQMMNVVIDSFRRKKRHLFIQKKFLVSRTFNVLLTKHYTKNWFCVDNLKQNNKKKVKLTSGITLPMATSFWFWHHLHLDGFSIFWVVLFE
jgi:hypothetical protein